MTTERVEVDWVKLYAGRWLLSVLKIAIGHDINIFFKERTTAVMVESKYTKIVFYQMY